MVPRRGHFYSIGKNNKGDVGEGKGEGLVQSPQDVVMCREVS